MVSREAEIFERANLVDVGVQKIEPEHAQRRSLDHSMDLLSLHGDTTSPTERTHPQRPNISGIDGFESENEDDDFELEALNIDEVDSPAIPHITGNAVNGSMDSNADNNMIVDEAFQKSLNERASQFASSEGNSINTNSFPEVPKPKVNYDYSDEVSFSNALDEWFTSKEMDDLSKFKQIFESHLDCGHYGFNRLGIDEKETVIEQLVYELNTDNNDNAISCMLFIALGAFDEHKFAIEDGITSIRRNCLFLVRSNVIPTLLSVFDSTFESCSTTKSGLVAKSNTLFHITTIIYVVSLVHSGDDVDDSEVETLRNIFDQHQTLVKLVKFIDEWRWNSRASLRIRNIIVLFGLLVQLQFGNLKKRLETKQKLCKKLGLGASDPSSDTLRASPVDFHMFRHDITSRYPSFIPPPSTLPDEYDDSSSLLQFITLPRPQAIPTRGSNIAQPPPSIHLATPASSPSPPPSPLSKSLKNKRSFQAHSSYPLIYPTEPGEDAVPKSILEASQLFASRVQEKLSLKQLWFERDIFMKQERGWTDASEPEEDPFSYLEDTSSDDLISLKRVESFYQGSINYLSSLVHVLVQLSVNSHASIDTLLGNMCTANELDMIRAKELLFKQATYILLLILKWFKTCHILKFEYLCTLIYDSNYLNIVSHYLKALNSRVLDRIECTTVFNYSKSVWINDGPFPSIDENFCFTLVNMLTITNVISRGKTQRILTINEGDPATALRNLLSIHNKPIWDPVLKIIKDITSFNGKKWKANNMDLISMVYLHTKSKLRDNWLSGKDVESEISDAYGQEIALRALIQFYNMRKYAVGMEKLGYEKKTRDFFTREVDLATPDI